MKPRILLSLLCIALLLSFVGCSIEKIDVEKKKDLEELPEIAKEVYLAIDKGFNSLSDKTESMEFDIPAIGTEASPYKFDFDFEAGFNIPNSGDSYADLLEGITLSGDITSNGSDYDISAEIGLAAAQGTLGADLYFDDETGLYFTIPGYMTDYLKIPAESFGGIIGGESAFGTELPAGELDIELFENFISALSALLDKYSLSVFKYIPESAYSQSEAKYTPSGSEKSVTVTKTVITLTPEDISAIIKGVAQELSQDTELFPAFVESLSNMLEGYATVIGEEFDKEELESEIYDAVNEAASEDVSGGEFDSFEITVYHTSKDFYELGINISAADEELEFKFCANPKTKLYEITISQNPALTEMEFYLYAGIGGEERHKDMTPLSFTIGSSGYTNFELTAELDYSSGKTGTKCIGEICLSSDSTDIELIFDASVSKDKKATNYEFNISSLKIAQEGTDIISGELSLTGTYTQLSEADVADMAPDFSNVVDITTVDDTYMSNLIMDLYSNPVIAAVFGSMMP